MYIGLRALTALAFGAAVAATTAHAQLRLSGYTTGSFTDLAEANTTVVNAADGSSASFATGIPVDGSTQSKISFKNASFTNVGSGDAIQTGVFTITNGMTALGSGAPEAQFNLGLHLTAPGSQTVSLSTIKFTIDHTPNLPGAVPDTFSVAFNSPAPVKIDNTLVKFHVGVVPLDFQVQENATVKKGDITVSFTPVSFTPVPEPSTYAAWGAALLVGLIGYRRIRAQRNATAAV